MGVKQFPRRDSVTKEVTASFNRAFVIAITKVAVGYRRVPWKIAAASIVLS